MSSIAQFEPAQFFSSLSGFDSLFRKGQLIWEAISLIPSYLKDITLDEGTFTLVAEHDRKPRKICYLPKVKNLLKNSLCDLSNGGRIYRVNYSENVRRGGSE